MMLGTHWQGSLGNPIAESTGPAGDIIKGLSQAGIWFLPDHLRFKSNPSVDIDDCATLTS